MKTRPELVARMDELHHEVQNIARHDKPTRSQAARLVEIQTEFNALEEEVRELDNTATQRRIADGIRSGSYRAESGSTSAADAPTGRERPGAPRSEVRGRALDLIGRAENNTGLSRSTLDAAAGWVEHDDTDTDAMARWVLIAGDERYRSAFAKVLRNPQLGQFEWSDEERAAFGRAQAFQRAMAIGSSPTGGYLVPFTLDPAILLTNAGTSNVSLRAAFSVKTIATSSWNGVTSAGVSAEWAAEAAEVADASPTLAQPTIPVYRGDAFVPFSFEMQGDAPSLEAELAPLLADAKERLEARAFILGTGTGQPRGLITAAAANAGSVVASSTADTWAFNDLYKLKKALPARHRGSAGWLGSEDVYDLVRQTAPDGTWKDPEGGRPGVLLGRSTYETSEMDGNLDAGQNNYLLAYGDLKQYYVVDRVGATVELVPHLFGANRRPTGQRGLLLWFRTGGDLVNPDAVRLLNV